MTPENVNPGNFKVEEIIYRDDWFSIAYGLWMNDTENRLAMRWNGDTEQAIGYPNANGNPMWFQITEELTDIFLSALLSSPHSDKKKILKIMTK